MRSILFPLVVFLFSASFALAEEAPFKQYNPDIDKYNFAKSFIMGLSYYSRVADRLALEDKDQVNSKPDGQAIRDFIDHRTQDNTELRIAKSYLMKYIDSTNGLIRKVTLDTSAVYEKLLMMSVRERDLWQELERFRLTGRPPDFDEQNFGAQQVLLAREKKEVAKDLIQQTVMVARVLLSAERCDKEDCRELAVTRDERDKLVQRLDTFARGNMEWGLKPGQSTVGACVAALREVLEDSVYQSQP